MCRAYLLNPSHKLTLTVDVAYATGGLFSNLAYVVVVTLCTSLWFDMAGELFVSESVLCARLRVS